jgi:hypothetical protein
MEDSIIVAVGSCRRLPFEGFKLKAKSDEKFPLKWKIFSKIQFEIGLLALHESNMESVSLILL